MHHDLPGLRFRQLIDSPGGCALLLLMAHNGLSPAEAVEPDTAVHLVSHAVGELNPWNPDHDDLVQRIRSEGERHAGLAHALVSEPGIARWWAPLARDRQVWIGPEMRYDFPKPDTFPALHHPPTRYEHYVQWPERPVSTSTLIGEWTSQLASVGTPASDWHMDYPARRKRVRVSSAARICEITSAEEWHALVTRHEVRSDPVMNVHSAAQKNEPWGGNDGLVPDWSSISQECDGVHITLWALLTGTQVRVRSDAGWTEMWSRGSEETAWLRWVFDEVEEMAPVDPLPEGPGFSLPFEILVPRQPGRWWSRIGLGQQPD